MAIASVALCGCQYDPHARNYTTYEPALEEFIGEYELQNIYMDSYSPGIADKVSKLSAPPVIRILADGTFEAEQYPYFSEAQAGFEYKFEDFRSLTGKWSQTTVGTISNGAGSAKTHYGISIDGLPSHLATLGFTGVSKVDGLIIGFGDPDSGYAITYKKRPPNKPRHDNP
jgi:hypothetical protein